MQLALSFLLFFIFIEISILHFYWGFGGQKFLNKALPTNLEGKEY